MSGVGSTNAMKKGSANNPFLAYSEADMQGFLNSAYTGCIVKYTGPSTKTAVPRGKKLSLGDAQNLVVDLTKNFTYSSVSYKSREWNIGIEIENSDNTKTNQCIMNIKIDSKTGIIGSGNNDIQALIYSEYTPYSSLYGKNINEISVKFLAVTSVNVDRDVVVNWPITYGKNGWQSDCFNDLGKITLWGYGETVLAYQNQNDMDYWGNGDVIYTEPYIVNELYKVVYSDGQYYFEEFYYISENVTTATVEDVAPGKTFYDFTGTKQTGTGTKINPYIASTADEMAAYLTSSYKGAFVKYIGETVTVGGTPIPVNPIAVGDTISKLYFDTTKEVDFSKFTYDQPAGDDIPTGVAILLSSQQNVNILTANDLSVVGMSGYVLMLTEEASQTSAAVRQTFLYASEAVPDLGVSQAGWQSGTSLDLLQGNTISIVNAQDIWGAYISKDGQWTSGGGESYVKNAVYQVAEDGDTTRYAILPTLSNPGTAADLAQGKQLIDGEGKVVEGTFTDDIDYTQDVMFWDYDGKLIYACTLDEAKAMTKLPDVPDHSDKGLVFLKWNYTLDDIKKISHGADIGALYETSDGKTHLFFDIVSDLTKSVTLYIIKSYNLQDGTLRIDWGDGTAEETYEWDKNTTPSSANFPKHTYTMTGQYEVKIENISAYKGQYIYLGSTSYSISDARNLFGLSLRYGSTNTISTILTKAYVGKRMALSCGACVNLTEISLRYGSVAPCGLQNTQVKHVNVASDIELYAFRYSAIQTFSCSSNSIEPGAFQNCYNIKRIACKAYTQTYADAVNLDLPSLRVCIWPRYSSYKVQLNIKACKKVVLDCVTQWDSSSTSTSLYLLAATKLHMETFFPYGNNTKVVASIISAPMLEQFIMNNVTPTPLTAAFTKIPNTCKYYVPDDAVDTYKSTEGWSEMADRIYPISALTN